MKGFERNREELRKARNTMVNKVTTGEVTALDRFGMPIRPGDMVVVHLDPDPVMQVLDIKPPIDPRQPVDQVTIILSVTVPMMVRAGLPVTNLLVIGSPMKEDVPSSADATAAGPKLVLTDTDTAPATAEEPTADAPASETDR